MKLAGYVEEIKPGSFVGHGFIDEVEVRSLPTERAFQVVVYRTYETVARQIAETERAPRWLSWASARQGSE